MELFLPGVIILLLSGFFAFMVIPRMGTTILIITSVISLLLAAYHHYYMFSSEYTLSTWQNALAGYAPWIVLLLAIVLIVGGVEYVFFGSRAIYNSTITPAEKLGNGIANSLMATPNRGQATNILTGAINTGINSVRSNSPVLPGTNFSSSQI